MGQYSDGQKRSEDSQRAETEEQSGPRQNTLPKQTPQYHHEHLNITWLSITDLEQSFIFDGHNDDSEF